MYPDRRFSVAVLLLALTTVAGCASSGGDAAQASPATAGGFLGDTSGLEPAPHDDSMRLYRKRAGILGEYDRFLVEPVLVALSPGSAASALDPAKLAELAALFHDEIVGQLRDGGYELVDEPGTGVLVVRIAITDVEVTKGAVNAAGRAAGLATGVGFLLPNIDVGGASVEGEGIDGATGERVIAVIDTDRGRRFLNLKGVRPTGDARTALREWAKGLRKRIDEAHGR